MNNYGIPSSIVPDREHEDKKDALLYKMFAKNITDKYFCGIDCVEDDSTEDIKCSIFKVSINGIIKNIKNINYDK